MFKEADEFHKPSQKRNYDIITQLATYIIAHLKCTSMFVNNKYLSVKFLCIKIVSKSCQMRSRQQNGKLPVQ